MTSFVGPADCLYESIDCATRSEEARKRNAAKRLIINSPNPRKLLNHGLYLGVLHEVFPYQSTTIVFDHHYDGCLIQPHENRRHPMLVVIESVAKTIFAP